MTRHIHARAAAAVATAFIAVGGANAADSPTSTTAGDALLQEIEVTATRRSEEISKVPISIVALDHAALETTGIKSIGDLANWVPGIEFDTSAGFGPNTLTNIAIRGINSNIGTSTTGIYLDDVPLQTRIVALSYWGNPFPLIFDVDRVEVDRGPQGTLFGAGAEGGAVRFVSPEPDLQKYSGFAHSELAFTQNGAPSYETGVAGGGPISADVVGFRASAWVRHDGGWVDRVDPITGQIAERNANGADSGVARLAITIKPSDAVKITPSLYWQQLRNDDSPAYYEQLSNPDAGVFRNGRLLAQPAIETLWVPSIKVDASVPGATITSISAYMHRFAHLVDDGTNYNGAVLGPYLSYGNPAGPQYPASNADASPIYLSTAVNLVTEELRASSDDPSASLKWTVGGFFSDASQTDTEGVYSPYYMVNFFGLPGTAPQFYSLITSRDSQLALFGQIDYRIAPQWTLTVGARVSHNIAKYFQAQSGPIASSEFPVASGQQAQTPIVPKIELSYQATEALLVYGSAGKGYRIGGANQPIPLAPTPAGCPLASQPPPFSGDSLWSYEVGSKSTLLGGHLKLDASVFYVDWSKIQQQIYFNSCSFGFIANTGSATSKGFDLSARMALTHSLSAGLSVAYTDAKISSTVEYAGATLVQAGDAVGSPPGVGSPWNLNGTVQYDFSLGGLASYLRTDGIYHSRNPGPFNTTIPGTPLYNPTIPANPPYSQFNSRLGISIRDVDLSLFANNLTNQHPALNRFIDTPTLGIYTDTTLRPRTIGMAANYKF
jgi:outer membrane receptor protein involved in Fe transport